MYKKGWELLKDYCLIFLFPCFFILHGINENFGLIPFKVITQLSFSFFLIATGIYFFSFLLLKKVKKTVVFSFYLLCVYFFFGAFHDFLKKGLQIRFLASYSFLLSSILFISITLFFVVKRSLQDFRRVSLYLNILIMILTAWEIMHFTYNSISSKAEENSLLPNNITVNKLNIKTVITDKPDIFFIVFDEYASSKSLLKEFNYKNYKLDSLLIANGFYISALSNSNYNITPFSISSTLNLNYLKPGLEKDEISKKQLLQSIETLKNNWLMQFLKSNGYSILNYGPFDFKVATSATPPFFYNDYFGLIDNQTLYKRVKTDIWWNFSTRNILTGKFQVPESYNEAKQKHLYRNAYNWNGLMTEINSENSITPRFVYAHLILPHSPYFLDSNGNAVSDKTIIQRTYNAKECYINQVAYANKLLQKLIPVASAKKKRGRIVIIEGDHGYRSFDKSSFSPDKTFMNLNAYYFSDRNYTQLYQSISPVNTFRVVLNKYFSQSYPLLKDSSIFLNDTTLMFN